MTVTKRNKISVYNTHTHTHQHSYNTHTRGHNNSHDNHVDTPAAPLPDKWNGPGIRRVCFFWHQISSKQRNGGPRAARCNRKILV